MSMEVFDSSGLASLDDLSTESWKMLFFYLEKVQEEFLAARPHVSTYPWPKDPLHNCTRVWEYPFVYHHLKKMIAKDARNTIVVDLGSGATFFPFAVARLGCRVLAVDSDENAKLSMEQAAPKVSSGRGEISFVLSDARNISLESSSVDCVYCISVLEHISDFERVIAEAARVLRPGGTFVLTFDIDLKGNFELGPTAYRRLMDVIACAFTPAYPERVIHPMRVLNSDNSIYPMYPSASAIKTFLRPLRAAVSGITGNSNSQLRLLVSTYGVCLRRLDD